MTLHSNWHITNTKIFGWVLKVVNGILLRFVKVKGRGQRPGWKKKKKKPQPRRAEAQSFRRHDSWGWEGKKNLRWGRLAKRCACVRFLGLSWNLSEVRERITEWGREWGRESEMREAWAWDCESVCESV